MWAAGLTAAPAGEMTWSPEGRIAWEMRDGCRSVLGDLFPGAGGLERGVAGARSHASARNVAG